mgnify:CR=1 FL=1
MRSFITEQLASRIVNEVLRETLSEASDSSGTPIRVPGLPGAPGMPVFPSPWKPGLAPHHRPPAGVIPYGTPPSARPPMEEPSQPAGPDSKPRQIPGRGVWVPRQDTDGNWYWHWMPMTIG